MSSLSLCNVFDIQEIHVLFFWLAIVPFLSAHQPSWLWVFSVASTSATEMQISVQVFEENFAQIFVYYVCTPAHQ